MFLDKYLNETYLDIVYSNYDEDYLKCLDERNFREIYNLLDENNFYFIEDIILEYMDLFMLDKKYVESALVDIKKMLGNDYVSKIGKDMSLINTILDIAYNYLGEDI